MRSYHLIIATPAGNVFDGNAAMLNVRGAEGDMAVLADHIPFVTSVKPGKCTVVFEDNTEKTAQIGGGVLTVEWEKTTLLSSSFKFDEE